MRPYPLKNLSTSFSRADGLRRPMKIRHPLMLMMSSVFLDLARIKIRTECVYQGFRWHRLLGIINDEPTKSNSDVLYFRPANSRALQSRCKLDVTSKTKPMADDRRRFASPSHFIVVFRTINKPLELSWWYFLPGCNSDRKLQNKNKMEPLLFTAARGGGSSSTPYSSSTFKNGW